jgi:hypothetical protein
VTLTQTTTLEPPFPPLGGINNTTTNSVTWKWNKVSGAVGYKWGTDNDYSAAVDIGLDTSKTELGIVCGNIYTRYVWAYSSCGVSTSTELSQNMVINPSVPTAGAHEPSASQIIWNWETVSGATGFKWNITDNYATASDIGFALSKTESGLVCNTPYSRYIWAYNSCGASSACLLNQSTTLNPSEPLAGTHVASYNQINWNWNAVLGATGYKWNTTNNYATAFDLGTATSKSETGLLCNTVYTRFVWAYCSCGHSSPVSLNQSTSDCPFYCGSDFIITHMAGTVAPVTKTVSYSMVGNIPGEPDKCWITSNLGADHPASSVNDDTEFSGGWYWRFNRKQGFKTIGYLTTPDWPQEINNENSDWIAANDPCTIELGNNWRIPTMVEWTNISTAGNWSDWNGPWTSGMKLHAAGKINYYSGVLQGRGVFGHYYSSSQLLNFPNNNWYGSYLLFTEYSLYLTSALDKRNGFSIRCLKENNVQ